MLWIRESDVLNPGRLPREGEPIDSLTHIQPGYI